MMFGCNEEEEVKANDVINIISTDNIFSMPADNTSTISITAYIALNSDSDKREIEFETNEGVFIDSKEKKIKLVAKDTIVINRNIYLGAVVKLKSSTKVTTEVKVTAKIYEYPVNLNLEFTNSPPKSISISSNVFGMDNSFLSEALLTATVKSDTGSPSSGLEVEFLVYNAADNSPFTDLRLREHQNSVNATGIATTKFTAGNLTLGNQKFVGDLKIIGKIIGTDIISNPIKLNIKQETN